MVRSPHSDDYPLVVLATERARSANHGLEVVVSPCSCLNVRKAELHWYNTCVEAQQAAAWSELSLDAGEWLFTFMVALLPLPLFPSPNPDV